MMIKRRHEILKTMSSLLVIAVCLSSCLKIEKVGDGASKELMLSPVASVMTKKVPGPVLGTMYSETETMGIISYKSETTAGDPWIDTPGTDTDDPELYINGVEFLFKDYANAWAGTTPQYWPETGSLIFAGYSPFKRLKDKNTPVKIENVSYDPVSMTLSIPDYAVGQYVPMTQDEIQDENFVYKNVAQSDLMFFLPKIDEDGNHVGVNNLASYDACFNHALSLVEFTVAAEDLAAINRVDLSSITLKEVYYQGDFSARTVDGELDIDWTELAVASDVDVFHSTDPAVGLELFLTPRTIAQILIIPGPTHPIKIHYHVLVNGKYYEQDAVFTPEDLGLTEWLPGKKYVYNLTLGVDRLTFSPHSEPWDEPEGGATIN